MGTYVSQASNDWGKITIATITLVVSQPPTIVSDLVGTAVTEGQPLNLRVTATSALTPVSARWYHDGAELSASGGSVVVSGATVTVQYSIAQASLASDGGKYYCVIANADGSVTSATVDVTVNRAAQIVNLSSRSMMGGAAGTTICGFVIAGNDNVPVLLRAVGPGLKTFGIAGYATEPSLVLQAGGHDLAQGAPWTADQAKIFTACGAFGLPDGSKDTAITTSVAPGSYTATANDKTGVGGNAMVEVYAGSTDAMHGRFVNASTRGFVGSGDATMTTGFVISGAGKIKVLLRAVGPKLRDWSVPDAISDPELTLFQAGKQIAANDNWENGNAGVDMKAVMTSAGAFPLDPGSKDAALYAELSEGTYTMQTTGVGGASGNALIELYIVP